jgi:hypothetical protein
MGRTEFLLLNTFLLSLFLSCNQGSGPSPRKSIKSETDSDDRSSGTDESSAKGKSDSSEGPSGSDNPGIDSSADKADPAFDLCQDGLESHQDLKSREFKGLVTDICGSDKNLLSQFRQKSKVYSGGDGKVFFIKSTARTTTSMELWSSSLVKTKPRDYFNMEKLKITKPKIFKCNGNYEVGSDIEYISDSDSLPEVIYEYTNSTRPANIVKYKAKAIFITLKGGQAYAIATLDQTWRDTLTIEDLTGLLIINAKDDTSTEVFTYSKQDYDNGNDEKTTVNNAQVEFVQEQERSYRNARTADKARNFLGSGVSPDCP